MTIEKLTQEMVELRQLLIAKKVIMKDGRTSHRLAIISEPFLDRIMAATSFLPPDAKLVQRWIHIRDGETSIPLCQECGLHPVKWKTKDYRLTCSDKCHVTNRMRGTLTTVTPEMRKESYEKGRETMLTNDPDAYAKMSKRIRATKIERGSDAIAAAKQKVTKKTVGDDGLNIAQRSRYKQIETLKADILPDGTSRFDHVGANISKALKASERSAKATKRIGEYKRTHKPDGVNTIATLAAYKGVAKCRETKEQNGTIIPLDQKTDFEIYSRNVWKITNLQDLDTLSNFELRGNHAFNDDAWHLDHKFSIIHGFLNEVPPELIGHIGNLEMLPWAENISKQSKSSITLEELQESYENFSESEKCKNLKLLPLDWELV